MVELTFSEMPPSANNLYPSHKGGGRHLSAEGRAWRELAGHELNRQHPEHIGGQVSLDIAIADKGQSDLDGKAKCLIDLLVSYGVIEQDNRHVVREIKLGWDASLTGCRVRVRRLEKVA